MSDPEKKPGRGPAPEKNPATKSIEFFIQNLDVVKSIVDQHQSHKKDREIIMDRVFDERFNQDPLVNNAYLDLFFYLNQRDKKISHFEPQLKAYLKPDLFRLHGVSLEDYIAFAQRLQQVGYRLKSAAFGSGEDISGLHPSLVKGAILASFIKNRAPQFLSEEDQSELKRLLNESRQTVNSVTAREYQLRIYRFLQEKVPNVVNLLIDEAAMFIMLPQGSLRINLSVEAFSMFDLEKLPKLQQPIMYLSLLDRHGEALSYGDDFETNMARLLSMSEDVLARLYEVKKLTPVQTKVTFFYDKGLDFVNNPDEIDPFDTQEVGPVELEAEPPTGVTLTDIGGQDEAVYQARIMVEAINFPGKFTKRGIELPKGALFVGPPGTGKTLLAKAIASEANATFISIEASQIVTKWFGEYTRNMAAVFDEATAIAETGQRVIIFIDELESLAPSRAESHQATQQIVSVILNRLDGMKGRSGIFFLAATNHPELVDSALLRPGRIDNIVQFQLPSEEGLAQIFEIHARKIMAAAEEPESVFDSELDLPLIARTAHRYEYVGADVKNALEQVIRRKIYQDVRDEQAWFPVTTAELVAEIASKPSLSAKKRGIGFIPSR